MTCQQLYKITYNRKISLVLHGIWIQAKASIFFSFFTSETYETGQQKYEWFFKGAKHLKEKKNGNICGLFTLKVYVFVNVNVNFNIELIVMQTLTQIMGLNTFSVCGFHHSIQNLMQTLT